MYIHKKGIYKIMGIKGVLDAQVWLVNKAAELGCQLAVKYQEWQYHKGNIEEFDFLEFKSHIGMYSNVAHNLATVSLFVICAIIGLVFVPSFGGRYAVFVGRLRARLGIFNKSLVYDAEVNRTRSRVIPKECLAFSSVHEAEKAGAFDNISGFSDDEKMGMPLQVGALYKSCSVGFFLSKCIGAYLIFFPFYYLFFGDAEWLNYIRAW